MVCAVIGSAALTERLPPDSGFPGTPMSLSETIHQRLDFISAQAASVSLTGLDSQYVPF